MGAPGGPTETGEAALLGVEELRFEGGGRFAVGFGTWVGGRGGGGAAYAGARKPIRVLANATKDKSKRKQGQTVY